MPRAARKVVVLAAGAGKERVVRAAMSGRGDTPLAWLFSGRGGKETVVVTHPG